MNSSSLKQSSTLADTFRKSLALFTLFLTASAPVLAQSRRLVTSGCRQGFCWETYVLGKKVIRQDQLDGELRTVYLVNVENQNSRGTDRRQDWVQCSTRKPYVAFTSSVVDTDKVLIHYLNPGGEFFGYNAPSHQMYWAICHDVWQADLSNMAEQARSLGYSLQLKTEQREVAKDGFNP